MTEEFLEEVRNCVQDRYYEVIDSAEVEPNLFLTIYCEDDVVLVYFRDHNNNCTGTGTIERTALLEMEDKDIENTINQIYYYNCNIPIEQE